MTLAGFTVSVSHGKRGSAILQRRTVRLRPGAQSARGPRSQARPSQGQTPSLGRSAAAPLCVGACGATPPEGKFSHLPARRHWAFWPRPEPGGGTQLRGKAPRVVREQRFEAQVSAVLGESGSGPSSPGPRGSLRRLGSGTAGGIPVVASVTGGHGENAGWKETAGFGSGGEDETWLGTSRRRTCLGGPGGRLT